MQNIPYALAVGSIMYAVRCTRPDVTFAQNITSRFQQNPGEEHWTAVKNILKYLRITKDMFLVYGGNIERELRVSCYTDAGYLTDVDNIKSQTGYVFVLNGGAVDWKSTKQSIFATSSTYAEYIAAFDASKEAVWIRKFIAGLGIISTIEEPISMYCDNTGAIAIAKDDGVTKGARHFRAKVHYLRETIKLGDVKIEKIDTDDNLADPFTKAVAFPKHSELTRNIGLLPASSFIGDYFSRFIRFQDHWLRGCILLVVYVDDIVITGSDKAGIKKLKSFIGTCFQMKDLETLKYFLGIEVSHSSKGICLSQRKYCLDFLDDAGQVEAKPCDEPMTPKLKLRSKDERLLHNPEKYRRVVGKLNYLTFTRPDIAFPVSVAEYKAMAQMTCEHVWLRNLLDEIGFPQSKPMKMWCDNQAAIYIDTNMVFHERTKHIEVDCQFTYKKLEDGTITTPHIRS
nr:retrotransposon protein, putative, Ty1-copia subclass [Tanacetum cinerariifolium]